MENKICLVADGIPGIHEKWSGAEQMCFRLSEILTKNNMEISYITPKYDNNTKKKFPFKIYQITNYFHKIHPLFNEFPIDLLSFIKVYKVLNKTKPSLVHLHSKTLFFPIILCCKLLKIPVAFTYMDHWMFCPRQILVTKKNLICQEFHGAQCSECLPKISPPLLGRTIGAMRKKIFNSFLDMIDAIIALNQTSREMLMKYGIPQNKIKIVYQYRLKENTNNNMNLNHEKPYIAFIGSLKEYKGLHIVIEAMKIVLKKIPDMHLIVIGDGDKDYIYSLKEKVEKLGISKSIHFIGKKSNEEVMNIISGSEAVVVPEQSPNVFGPIILIEAMGMGKLVIASNIGGTREYIIDGENGFLIKHDEPGEYAEKIIWVAKNKASSKEFGRRAKKKVSFLYKDDLSEKVNKVYHEIINNRSG